MVDERYKAVRSRLLTLFLEYRLSHRFLHFLTLTGLLAGCQADRDRQETQYAQVPDSAKAGFAAFADSVAPAIMAVLEPFGLHGGESDTVSVSEAGHYSVSLVDVTLEEADAQVYEAFLTMHLHTHWEGSSDLTLPETIDLTFGGNGAKWLLLTADGYLFSLFEDDNRSGLPFDAQRAVREVLQENLEWIEWYRFKQSIVPAAGNGSIPQGR